MTDSPKFVGGHRVDKETIRSLRKIFRISYLAFAALMSAFCLSSYFAYTTAGVDFEVPSTRGRVDVFYYRLRWDDGSVWAGLAVQPVNRPDRSLDWFDPGGTLLARPIRPEHQTWANARGFWWIGRPADDPYVVSRYPGAWSSHWAAVPSWLVLVFLWYRPLWRSWTGMKARLIRPASVVNSESSPE